MLKSPRDVLRLNKRSPTLSVPWVCISCQSKLQWQSRKASGTAAPAKPAKSPKGSNNSQGPPPNQQRVKGEAPVLQTLNRIIGVDKIPQTGENPAKDPRPWSDRRDAYWERDAHDARRKKIYEELQRPYYDDWKHLRHHKGKKFLAPEAPFKADIAKYFPNFQGYTLANSWGYVDTTKILKGNVTIVCYSSQTWAEWQVQSFVGKKENPALTKVLEDLKEKNLQMMFINYEDDFFKQILVYLFYLYARRRMDREHGKEVRERSLIVTRGVDRKFFGQGLGINNLRVGFIYLVDRNCKIRWVGTGYASEEEKASLVRVAKSLVREQQEFEARKKTFKPKPAEKKISGPKSLESMMM